MQLRQSIQEHNAEQKQVWDRLWAGNPVRVPVVVGMGASFYLDHSEMNPNGYSFEQYTRDPDVMIEVQLAAAKWMRNNLNWYQDAEVGPPETEWEVCVDFQNCYEAAWFGCKVVFAEGQPPDTRPILTDDNKNMLFDRGIPDPLNDNIMGDVRRTYERWKEKLEHFTFEGKPARCTWVSGLSTDGPLTVAMNLRGSDFLSDLYLDTEWAHKLLDFIVEATITRIEALRTYLDPDMPPGWATDREMDSRWGFADDAVQMLGLEAYREHILPHHKRLAGHFATDGYNYIHLCGNVQRLLPTIRDELNVRAFDTGFPINWETLRDELGDECIVKGGVPIAILKYGTPAEVAAEAKRILQSGIMHGGKFIMREASGLPPGTSLENVAAMYETTKKFGRYEQPDT